MLDNLTTATRVDNVIAARRMLDHPFYQAWTAGELSREVLKEYAKQYFHHVEAFPRAVSATHANCPDREGRRMLAENLAEEEGLEAGKTDHPELWMQFARGLGASDAEVEGVALNAETRALIAAFQTESRASYARGLGALYAYETQIPEVARQKIDGCKKFYAMTDEDELRFFTVHEVADVEHAEVCRQLLDRLSPEESIEAEAGAAALSEALLGFLDGVSREAGVAGRC
ncbi:MAG: CADD family putative folate metabolism protein [Maricaulaceae bacterium]|jgi:pyrroloquinoline-quinone synthase